MHHCSTRTIAFSITADLLVHFKKILVNLWRKSNFSVEVVENIYFNDYAKRKFLYENKT